MNEFDDALLAAQRSDAPEPWRDALIAVGDTAFICRAWLNTYAPGYTPADLLAMTRLVIEQEYEAHERGRRREVTRAETT
jgi:hypothetical protein